jgi:hypothetical protein
MSRSVALVLVVTLASPAVALAEESLLASATKIARDVARREMPTATSTGSTPRAAKIQKRRAAAFNNALAQDQAPALAASGMSKTKKFLIALAAGVGFAATAYAIDQNVQDITPSTLGTRED